MSLFGKLFIDHKTIYYDVEPFKFFVLTEANGSFDHPLGFFSRVNAGRRRCHATATDTFLFQEIVSYDDYNLACIVTFPPYQQQGYGTLLMEFSERLPRPFDRAQD